MPRINFETIGLNIPEPVFNADDNEECLARVFGWYDHALEYQKRVVRIELSYRDVLARQRRFGVELVNNQEFYDWASSGPQEEQGFGGSDEFHRERYESKFVEVFGSHDDWEAENGEVVEAQPLRTFEELD